VAESLHLRDIFNISAVTAIWNAAATLYLVGGGNVPAGLDYGLSRPAMIGLGLLFTAASGIQWHNDVNRGEADPESGRTSGGDEPSVRGP
jgi:hypothetical protein